jgi:hypothetical protein
MGNTQKPKGKEFSLARYRREAKKYAPFELWLDDDTCLSIAKPDVNQLLDAESAERAGDGREALRCLCGDQFDALISAIGGDDIDVLQAITEDMREHWGLGN